MALKLPNSAEVKLLLRRVLRPKSKLGKTTLWFGGLALILQLLQWITRSPPGTMLSGWATFIVFVFAACGSLMLLRWVRRQLMWRLRNRLIVTYVFIGVIPIVLLVAMALLAGYLFAGQFATYVAMADLQADLQHSGLGQHRAGGATCAVYQGRQTERANDRGNCERLG